MSEFLNSIRPMVDRHLNRQVFVLLATAFDSFLDRKGFAGTLGQRFMEVKKLRMLPNDLLADMDEIIQRRNDIAHGGVVSANYIAGVTQKRKPTLAHQSGWLAKRGIPSQAGASHQFDPEYLYWATSAMYRLAKLC